MKTAWRKMNTMPKGGKLSDSLLPKACHKKQKNYILCDSVV
jgi:hypothetical protein